MTLIASRLQAILGSPAIGLQEVYPCSEGFIGFGDPATGLLRLVFDHGIFYEFVPVDELDSPSPTRHWLGTVRTGINYAIVVSTCAGMWAHVIGDTVRFESLDPPLISFTGRTRYTLSAFGEHLISEEVEAAMARASSATGASVREWHVGPVFLGRAGYHQYVVEFLRQPADLERFRDALDADSRAQRRLPGPPRPRRGAAAARAHRPRERAVLSPGCVSAANWEDKTKCREWITRASSRVIWWRFCVRTGMVADEVRGVAARHGGSGGLRLARARCVLVGSEAVAGQAAAFF